MKTGFSEDRIVPKLALLLEKNHAHPQDTIKINRIRNGKLTERKFSGIFPDGMKGFTLLPFREQLVF